MLGIVIPAHNEALLVGAALASVMTAAQHPGLQGEVVEVVVVLDSCDDATGFIAARTGARTVSLRVRNVGMARAVGAEAMLAGGARWLAFTDADTVVSPAWLVDQLGLQADAVCGSIGVEDWSCHGVHADALNDHFQRTYTDVDGHRHIHGANLGVSAAAYRRAGGFRHLACGEDVALVRALQETGAHIVWSAKPRVVTSSRRDARARGGFGDALLDALANSLGVQAACGASLCLQEGG